MEDTTTNFTNTSSSTFGIGAVTTTGYYTPTPAYLTNNKSFSAYNWESMVEATLKIIESQAITDFGVKAEATSLLMTLLRAGKDNMVNNQAVLA